MTEMNKSHQESKFVKDFLPILLIFSIGAITTIPFLSRMGVYHDDWKIFSPLITSDSMPEVFMSDRPGLGFVYQFLLQLLGYSPSNWQVYYFVLRFVCSLLFFLLNLQLFPGKRILSTIAASLFFIFPGFYEHSNAITFSNQFLTLFLGLVSINLTVLAFRSERKNRIVLFSSLAVITELGYLFLYEYFIGLEALRLILVFFLVNQKYVGDGFWKKAGRAVVVFLPYLAGMFIFLVWRFGIFHATRSTVDPAVIIASITGNPISFTFKISIQLLTNVISAILSVWSEPIKLSVQGLSNDSLAVSVGLGVFASAISFLGIWVFYRYQEQDTTKRYPYYIVGIAAVISCILPIIISGRSIIFSSGFDRYTIPALIGSILIIAGLIQSAGTYGYKILFPLLVFIGVFVQANFAMKAIDYWQAHRDFWWQLSWRAPDLKDSTILIPVTTGDSGFWDIWEIFVPANLIYRGETQSLEIFSEILNTNNYREIASKQSKEVLHRSIYFNVDFHNALVMSMPIRNTCLHVWDAQQYEKSPGTQIIHSLAVTSSNISQIDPNNQAAKPPREIFGVEPDHTWCYYFEKASLARQQKNWSEVVRLAEESAKNGYFPVDRTEWLPFLEGYLNLADTAGADWVLSEIKKDNNVIQAVCEQLDQYDAAAYSSQEVFDEMVALLCSK